MDRERRIDLIQLSIDGALSGEEQAELEKLLATDNDAADLHASLLKTARLVEQIEEADPPAGLRRSIMDSIGASGLVGPTTYKRGLLGNLRNGGVVMNRKYAIAAVCVVVLVGVVAYFGYWNRPNNGDAVGAIGAVEKHRAKQISDQDVILGEEAECEDCIPYGDMLESAAVMLGSSAELEAMSQLAASAQAEGLDARMRALDLSFKNHMDSLDARMLTAARFQLAAMKSFLDMKSLPAGLESRVQSYRLELDAISKMLDAKKLDFGAIERLAAIQRDLGARMELGAKPLVDARMQLEAFNQGLDNSALTLDQKTLDMFSSQLEATSRGLDARSLLAAKNRLDARQSYLDAMSVEFSKLRNFSADLDMASRLDVAGLRAKADSLSAWSADLRSRAADLEAKALLGMKGQLEAATRTGSTLDAMSRVSLESRDLLNARAADLEAKQLGSFKDMLGAIDNSLEARKLDAKRLFVGEMRYQLGAAHRLLGAKDLQLGAYTLDNMRGHLVSLGGTLEARQSLEASTLEAMSSQLEATKRQLEARRATFD
jgi:hypothetical protein